MPDTLGALVFLHCPRVEEKAGRITATNSVRSMAASPSRSSLVVILGLESPRAWALLTFLGGVVGAWSDLAVVPREHSTDRLDPRP